MANGGKPLQGMRLAILREHMVTPTPNHVAISPQIDREIKQVLRDALGAELVETITWLRRCTACRRPLSVQSRASRRACPYRHLDAAPDGLINGAADNDGAVVD